MNLFSKLKTYFKVNDWTIYFDFESTLFFIFILFG